MVLASARSAWSITVTPAVGAPRTVLPAPVHEPLDELGEQWGALVLATRDYVRKSGFTDVAVARKLIPQSKES